MKLDRNLGLNRGKYALIKMRVSGAVGEVVLEQASGGLECKRGLIFPREAVDCGNTSDTDFFVIRLKDKYAAPALAAYAGAAMRDDPEYALEVLNLAKMAAEHPNQKQPD